MAVVTLTVVAISGISYVLKDKQIAGFHLGSSKWAQRPVCSLVQDNGVKVDVSWDEMQRLIGILHPAGERNCNVDA